MRKLIVLMLLVFLSACSQEIETVPLIVYDESDLYMQDFRDLIIENNHSEFEITSYNSKNSQVIQNEIIESSLNGNHPLLIVNPVDRLGVYPIIQKAEELHTPIIFINREPIKEDLDLWDHVYYVGAKAEQSAQLQAELVIEAFGSNPNSLNELDINGDNMIQAVILKGQPGHQDAELRTKYVIEYIEEAGFELDVLTITEAYFQRERAESEMENIIGTYGNQIEVVICNNDAMAIGAIYSLVAADYFVDSNNDGRIERETEKWIPVVGIDGLPPAIDLIDTGYLYGTVLNDSEQMAVAINELMNAIINDFDFSSLSYSLEEDKYIWIDYQKYTVQ